MDRRSQLDDLIASLDRLLSILEKDPACRWTDHFRGCLEEARRLVNSGFTQGCLNALSASILSVYGGLGSFGDYAPIKKESDWSPSWTPIPGTEDLDSAAVEVFERALALRSVDS